MMGENHIGVGWRSMAPCLSRQPVGMRQDFVGASRCRGADQRTRHSNRQRCRLWLHARQTLPADQIRNAQTLYSST